MADEGKPPEPPRFPPPDDAGQSPAPWQPAPPSVPPRWPDDAPNQGWGQPGYGPPGYGAPPGPYGYGYGPGGGGRQHWLHPLTVGRTFSSAWRLYRFNWRPMVGLLLVLTVPIAFISAVVTGFAEGPELAAWQDAYQAAIRSGNFSNLPAPPAASGISLIFSLLTAVLSVIATAGVVHIIGAAYRGGKETAGVAFRAALGRIGTLIAASLLLVLAFIGVALVIGVAAIALALVAGTFGALIGVVGAVAAFVFFGLRWSLFVQAIMLEGTGAIAGLGRSWGLVNGSTWRVLGYYLLMFLVLLLVEFGLGIIVGIVAIVAHTMTTHATGLATFTTIYTDPLYLVIVALGTSVIAAFVTPWSLAVLTLLYYDLRWQRGETLPEPQTATQAASAG